MRACTASARRLLYGCEQVTLNNIIRSVFSVDSGFANGEAQRQQAIALTAEQAMTRTPATVGPRELASTALSKMEQRKITSVVVVDENQRVCGVLHLHDLWTLELF